jgi:uncharacterized membrane protein YhaH (DUF805 family)
VPFILSLFPFSGRLSVGQFWLRLPLAILPILPSILNANALAPFFSCNYSSATDCGPRPQLPFDLSLAFALSVVGLIIIGSLSTRRLHDLNLTAGWRVLCVTGLAFAATSDVHPANPSMELLILPGGYVLIQMLFCFGLSGTNEYGPSPLSDNEDYIEGEIEKLRVAAEQRKRNAH